MCPPGTGWLCDAAAGTVGKAAGSAFDAAASKLLGRFGQSIELSLTFWTDVDLPTLQERTGPVHDLQASTHWFTLLLATACIMIAGLKIAYSGDHRHGYEAIRGTLTWVFVAGAGVAAINAVGSASDAMSRSILDDASEGQLHARLGAMGAAAQLMPPGLGMMVAFVGILASLVQIMLMMARVGMVTIVAGVLPLAAAGSGSETGKAWFNKLVSWVVAYLLYKPAAAIVYAAAFVLIGDGNGLFPVLIGMFMIMLSVLALPALMRLVTPIVSSATSHGGGAALAGLGAAAATGAKFLADRGGGGGGGGGGSHAPGLVSDGPTGAPNAPGAQTMTATQNSEGVFNVTNVGSDQAASAAGGASAGGAGAAAGSTAAGASTGGAFTAVQAVADVAKAAQGVVKGAADSSAGMGS